MTAATRPEVAPAKVNLFLHVLGRRADGYHEIESLIAFAACGDRVTAAPAAGPALALHGPFAAALRASGPEADNLALRAERAFVQALGGPRLAIGLDKRLPLAAGLGGGSADAAAVLRLAARRAGIGDDDGRLAAVAAGLGADVPACLLNRPCLARGLGERLQPRERVPEVAAVLVNPGVALPTAAVFAAWSPQAAPAPCAPERIAGAGDAAALADALGETHNMLQPSACRLAPAVTDAIGALQSMPGCVLARMSGSGATCFGVFGNDRQAGDAAAAIARRQPGWWVRATRLLGWPAAVPEPA
ncbi:MAG: 4-(cytidine 5'-diphospho)-2-C-methyl-D-erythritol kinase [Alphaproteobacteria bacterium]